MIAFMVGTVATVGVLFVGACVWILHRYWWVRDREWHSSRGG